MKEYKVMVKLVSKWHDPDKWYKASGCGSGRQPVFTEKADAVAWLERARGFYEKRENHFKGVQFKIMERIVAEWTDSE